MSKRQAVLNTEKQVKLQTERKNLRFNYFHTSTGRTLTLVRELVDTQNGGKELRVGFALQNPMDQHDKELARTIASGRLRKHPVCVDLTLLADEEDGLSGRTLNAKAVQAVLEHAQDRGRLVYLTEALDEVLDSATEAENFANTTASSK